MLYEGESLDILDSEFASPRVPAAVNPTELNDAISDEEDGGLDELIMIDESE